MPSDVTLHFEEALDAELEQRARAIEQERQDIAPAIAWGKRYHGCLQRPVPGSRDQCPVSAGVRDIAVLNVV